MGDVAPRRSSGAWEIELARPGPRTARTDRCSRLLLLWSAAAGVVVVLYLFVGYVWASVATAVLLAAGCWFTCHYFNATPEQPEPAEAVVVGLPRVLDGGLSQEDIDAMPVFEYRRGGGGAAAAAAVVQCSVCIGVVKEGETVRRLPACGHAFHAPCVDGWLRQHATCPMCRADVKVAAGQPPAADGRLPPV